MRRLTCIVLLAGSVTCAAGTACAAEGKGAEPTSGSGRAGVPTTSMGAGGLTGTGATRDGARTGAGADKGHAIGSKPPSAPAAGTTR